MNNKILLYSTICIVEHQTQPMGLTTSGGIPKVRRALQWFPIVPKGYRI